MGKHLQEFPETNRMETKSNVQACLIATTRINMLQLNRCIHSYFNIVAGTILQRNLELAQSDLLYPKHTWKMKLVNTLIGKVCHVLCFVFLHLFKSESDKISLNCSKGIKPYF